MLHLLDQRNGVLGHCGEAAERAACAEGDCSVSALLFCSRNLCFWRDLQYGPHMVTKLGRLGTVIPMYASGSSPHRSCRETPSWPMMGNRGLSEVSKPVAQITASTLRSTWRVSVLCNSDTSAGILTAIGTNDTVFGKSLDAREMCVAIVSLDCFEEMVAECGWSASNVEIRYHGW